MQQIHIPGIRKQSVDQPNIISIEKVGTVLNAEVKSEQAHKIKESNTMCESVPS